MLIAYSAPLCSLGLSFLSFPFLLCFSLTSCLVVAHYSNVCTEAWLCWSGLNEGDWGGGKSVSGERLHRTGWWVSVCAGKTTIQLIVCAPLGRSEGGRCGSFKVESSSKRVSLCETQWEPFSAWRGGGPSPSSLVSLTSRDLRPLSDKGHRPRWWGRPSLNTSESTGKIVHWRFHTVRAAGAL